MSSNKLVVFVVIIVVVYGDHQNCDTYGSGAQYINSTISCKSNKVKCKDAILKFNNVSSNLLEDLNSIEGNNFILDDKEHVELLNVNNDKVNRMIMEKFLPICQRYTDVMAHKQYLQHLLFNRSYGTTNIIKLSLVIIKLQILANSLQAAQIEDAGTSCVNFTPAQYIKIYYSRNKASSDALCLLRIKALSWQKKPSSN